jgi:carboxyl-terminal processing protease
VFDSFIDALDPSRIVLLKSEYESLSFKYRFNLDNFIHENDCSSFPVFSPYTKWPLRNKSLLERMKTETIDYKQKDTIVFIKALSSRE